MPAELPVGVVLMVLGGLLMYLGCFREGLEQGLRKLSEENWGPAWKRSAWHNKELGLLVFKA